jgi:Zn-dependent peptidase ImmA (M78 family)
VPFAGDADDVSGMLYRDAHKTIIGVNESDHENRQRFTIAHELGHLHLHPVDRLHLDRNFRVAFRDSRSSTGADVREVEANEFAAELLMPAEMLRKDLEGRAIDIEDDSKLIEGLARTYQVSVQAMTYRLTNLGLIGAIVA